MSVSTTHPEYDSHRLQWQRLRDVVAGRDAMLARCSTTYRLLSRGVTSQEYYEYIPRLSGQTEHEYATYTQRAEWFGATSRTVDALGGMVMAKPPVVELPAPLDAYAEDITLAGDSLREFTQNIVTEEITVNRVGVLVDYPAVQTAGMSRADAERLNVRPFLRMYKGETIINWRTAVVNGAKVPALVVLTETREIVRNEFSSDTEKVFRVLDLTEQGYRVRLMNEKNELLSETFPLMNGRPMGYIPFAVVGGLDVRKPMLLDLCDTNIAWFRNSADFEHGTHFTALPTPYVSGVSLQPGETLNIGSNTAWVFQQPDAKAAYLEFKGDGLNTVRTNMADKQQRMAILGARLLVDEKRSAEATDTLSIRTSGERTMLAATANDVADAMRRCLMWMAEWVGVNPALVEFDLSIDYGAQRMNPQMLTALTAAVQAGLMPLSVYHEALVRGEITSVDFEAFEGQLETQAPALETPAVESNGGIMGSLRQRFGLNP